MNTPYLNILKDGNLLYAVTPDLCELATINARQESKAFEFVASEFSFALKNSAELYRRVNLEEELDVVVVDTTQVWFRGVLSAGGGWNPNDKRYRFRAIGSSKKIVEKWKTIPFNSSQVQGPGGAVPWFPLAETMPQALKRATGCEIVISDFGASHRTINYVGPGLTDDYTVYDFVLDCAADSNSVFWIDAEGRLRMRRRSIKDAPIEVLDELICGWDEKPQARDYEKVLYSSLHIYSQEEMQAVVNKINDAVNRSLKDNNAKEDVKKFSAELEAMRTNTSSYGGRRQYSEVSLTSSRDYETLPDEYEKNRVLDMRVPKWWKSKTPVHSTIFPMRVATNGSRWAEWDEMMKPKKIIEIGVRGLTRYEPYTRIKCRDIVGTVAETAYDLPAKRTTLTIEATVK